MEGISVCIDDERAYGDVVVRNPENALFVLHTLLKSISRTYWDNDMGGGWELEGRNLLKKFLQDCQSINHWPEVVIITANIIAHEDMETR